MSLKPGLYIAATPIGNLKDVTFRVIETLKACDLILCEDTRRTAKLCAAYAISTPRESYHDHNAAGVRPRILAELREGKAIALVSDAGTPLISDPGYKLVREARDAGVAIIPLPGPSAALAALVAVGAPTDRFLFAGFPPNKSGQRKSFLAGLKEIDATLVFFETGPRLGDSLSAMAAELGDRRAAMARELTKIHEEVVEGRLTELAARYAGAEPKGEIVIVVHPAETPPEIGSDEIDRRLLAVMSDSELSVKAAAERVAEMLHVPRKQAYDRALRLRGKQR